MKEHSCDFKSVVLLQNCMGLIKGEPDSGSEACVTALDDGIEKFNMEDEEADIKGYETEIKVEESDIKIEDAIDIKEENPDVKTFPPVNTKPEVSVWGLCVRQQQFVLPRPFTATKRDFGNYILTIIIYIPCILCRLLFIPTNAQHIY